MLIHGFNHHYRFAQKNLFLGESLRVFANPDDDNPADPTTGGQQGQGGVGNTPVPNILASKMGAGGGIEAPPGWEAAQVAKSKLFEEIKEWIPERKEEGAEVHQSVEIQEQWLSALAEYNGVQTYIDWLLKIRKGLTDDVSIMDNPLFKHKYQAAYQKIAELEKIKELDLGGVDWTAIHAKIANESSQNTRGLYEDINVILKKLVERRKMMLEVIQEKLIVKNFERRIQQLEDKWKNDPPTGNPQGATEWIGYCKKLREELKKTSFKDSDDPEFPKGVDAIQQWRDLWAALSQMEYSYDLFKKGQEHELSVDKLDTKFGAVEKLYNHVLNDDFNNTADAMIGEVLGPGREVLSALEAQYQSLYKEPWKDSKDMTAEEQEKLSTEHARGVLHGEIAHLRKTIENLEGNKNLKKRFHDILYSEEPLVDKKSGMDAITPLSEQRRFPKGLKGQIDYLRDLPCSEDQRRHLNFRMNESLDRAWVELKEMNKYLESALPSMLQTIQLYKQQMNTPDPKQKWEIVWLPPKSYEEIGHTIQNLFKRSYERDTKQKVGKAGKQFFDSFTHLNDLGEIPKWLKPVTELSSEFDVEREHAETEGYQHYTKVHEHASVDAMQHHVAHTNNEFEFRGLMELLSKKGRIRWDSEDLYRQLNRFQHRVHVPLSKHWHLENRSSSEDVIWKAITAIYGDQDIYRNWVSQNSSAIKSLKGEKKAHFGEISAVRGGLETKIAPILKHYLEDQAKDKHFSDADPIEYEALMEYGIEQGKMDAEEILYYMIMGIGTGLLPLERGSELTGMNNNYPAIEFFEDKTWRGHKPTLEDIEELAAGFKDNKPAFFDWYHRVVTRLPKVSQRLQKALSQGIKLDHDYFTSFAGYTTSGVVDSLLRQGMEGARLQQTAIQNGTEGMLMALDSMVHGYEELNAQGKFDLERFVDSFVRYDAILNRQMYRNRNDYTRLENTERNTKPRYSGAYGKFYGRGGNTTGENLSIMRNYFKELDFEMDLSASGLSGDFKFLTSLFANKIPEKDAEKYGLAILKVYPDIFGPNAQAPRTLDELYQGVGSYVEYIQKKRPDCVIRLISRIKADHETAFTKMRAERKDTVREYWSKAEKGMQHYRDEVRTKRQKAPPFWDVHGDHGSGTDHHSARNPLQKEYAVSEAAAEGASGGGEAN